MRNLIILKWTDNNGERNLRLRNVLSPRWRDAGDLLELGSSRIEGIAIRRHEDIRQCCSDVLQDWLRNGSPGYPATWDGMLALLEDLQLPSHNLKSALDFFQN